jgi:hypothetical protein
VSEITESSLMIAGERPRGGRPRSEEPKERVSAWMPTKDIDKLTKLASANNMTVSGFIGYVVSGYVRHRRQR